MAARNPLHRGHRYQRDRLGAWCGCGHYCGGLGQHDGTRANPAVYGHAWARYQLHLVQVRNERRER